MESSIQYRASSIQHPVSSLLTPKRIRNPWHFTQPDRKKQFVAANVYKITADSLLKTRPLKLRMRKMKSAMVRISKMK
jgi:hypothetical protein